MIRATIVVREVGRAKPEFSLVFDLPTLPRAGDYISIRRPDVDLHTEDLIVRHVWWELRHPETRGFVDGDEEPLVGSVDEILIECDQAIGPTSRDRWRDSLEAAIERGIAVERFDVERFSIRQDEMG